MKAIVIEMIQRPGGKCRCVMTVWAPGEPPQETAWVMDVPGKFVRVRVEGTIGHYSAEEISA